MLRVELLIIVPFLHGGAAADGGDVDHAVAELDKGAPLHGTVDLAHVPQAEVHELLVLVLAQPGDEAVPRQRLAQSVGGEAVFRKGEVEEGGHVDGGRAELFLLFDEVGAADEADGAFVAEGGEEGEDFGGGGLGRMQVSGGGWGGGKGGSAYTAGGRKGAIDVE